MFESNTFRQDVRAPIGSSVVGKSKSQRDQLRTDGCESGDEVRCRELLRSPRRNVEISHRRELAVTKSVQEVLRVRNLRDPERTELSKEGGRDEVVGRERLKNEVESQKLEICREIHTDWVQPSGAVSPSD